MKAIGNGVILKINKKITKEKVFDQESKKMKTEEKVELENKGVVIDCNSPELKKGDDVMFNFYGAIEVEDKPKYKIVVVDFEDIRVKL